VCDAARQVGDKQIRRSGVAGRGTEDVKVGADQHDSGAEGDSAAKAVSGGVDSMTLAVIAHRDGRGAATMFHAVSPAVPPEATERVRRYAHNEGRPLT
jgi:tRNA(Ile)-lysidine synthase TilS/MesJ